MKDSIERELAVSVELGHMADARIVELTRERNSLRDDVERMARGEKWIAEQLMQMLVAIIPALADAAIVTDQPFHADYVLSWVKQLASEHKAVAAERDALRIANQKLTSALGDLNQSASCYASNDYAHFCVDVEHPMGCDCELEAAIAALDWKH